jgi:leucyl aminopeptidase (aminopeptidase T)
MKFEWGTIAQRLVQALGVKQGELIEVQDNVGRFDVLQEVLLAIESAGATPLTRIASPDYLVRLLAQAPVKYLSEWDRHRGKWLATVDRILILGSTHPDFSSVSPDALHQWQHAVERLTVIEEERRIPIVVAGIPTLGRAHQSGCTLEALEDALLPALAATAAELQAEISRALAVVEGCRESLIQTNNQYEQYELRLRHGNRPWMSDDGCIDEQDRERGAIVSNIPGGSIYTTVLESETEGTLWLPRAGTATDIVFRFSQGRVVEIEAGTGADELEMMFNAHSGEPRRIGHIGIGLNPHLGQPIEWTLIDEHVHGSMFVSFGENRYMGGGNQSSLNIDYAIPSGTFVVDGRTIVTAGKMGFGARP